MVAPSNNNGLPPDQAANIATRVSIAYAHEELTACMADLITQLENYGMTAKRIQTLSKLVCAIGDAGTKRGVMLACQVHGADFNETSEKAHALYQQYLKENS